MNSLAKAARAAARTSSSEASGLPSAMLSLTLALLTHVSCSTMPQAARRLRLVTERTSRPSTEMEPESTS